MSSLHDKLDEFIAKLHIIKPMDAYTKLQLKNKIKNYKKDVTILDKTAYFIYGSECSEEQYRSIWNIRLDIIHDSRFQCF
jgi:hypothetical protein